jgi:branched-subunit amino acid aminotransferase/4-amino-4-deoxychorismate lyase
MPGLFCYANNRFVPYATARIHISDLGLQRGFGIFDYMQEVNGKVPFFDDYLDRFYSSANGLGMEVPLDRPLLKEKVYHLLRENKLVHSGIKLILTGGYSEDLYHPGQPNFFILNIPLEERTDAPVLPLRLITLEYQRYLPEVKTLNYLPSVLLLPEMGRKGAADVLFHQQGRISETSRANFFMVNNGRLVTPAVGILRGITRKHVLALAGEFMEVEERDLYLQELDSCDEAFITGTSKPVAPVIQVGTVKIKEGETGPATRRLMDGFGALIRGITA